MKTNLKHFIRYGLALVLMVILVAATVACSSTPAPAPTPTAEAPHLTTFTLAPGAPANLLVGATQQFVAMGTYSDGSTKDISSQVFWANSDASIATISLGGLATGVVAGTSGVSAAISGVTSPAITLTVTVL